PPRAAEQSGTSRGARATEPVPRLQAAEQSATELRASGSESPSRGARAAEQPATELRASGSESPTLAGLQRTATPQLLFRPHSRACRNLQPPTPPCPAPH